MLLSVMALGVFIRNTMSECLNVVGCKWVFRIKCWADSTVELYKAPLVAKGFHQKEGWTIFRLSVLL